MWEHLRLCRGLNFNPRAPYGARRRSPVFYNPTLKFQSTRPIRGATVAETEPQAMYLRFQSTRPIRGATKNLRTIAIMNLFQSTRPIRGATVYLQLFQQGLHISIHAPHTGRDIIFAVQGAEDNIFQSTRPIRGAT